MVKQIKGPEKPPKRTRTAKPLAQPPKKEKEIQSLPELKIVPFKKKRLPMNAMQDPVFALQICEQVIALGREGKSQTQISAAVDIHKSTFMEWKKKYPAFEAALARSKELEQAWWEDRGQEGLNNFRFNAHLWIKSMTARFHEDYRESKKTVFVGSEQGGPVQIITGQMSPKDASELYMKALEQGLG